MLLPLLFKGEVAIIQKVVIILQEGACTKKTEEMTVRIVRWLS